MLLPATPGNVEAKEFMTGQPRLVGSRGRPASGRDRSILLKLWWDSAQVLVGTLCAAISGWRVTGRENFPRAEAALLVSNHLSFLDVFALGIASPRPLHYMARSSLFVPGLSALMRSVGGFPIQREGMGVSGMKETLRRLRAGGVVTLFPEGTRSQDGELGPLKAGIATLVSRAEVAVIPAGIAGTFEAWPRNRPFPLPHPVRVHFGEPIPPEVFRGLEPQAVMTIIRQRMADCFQRARHQLHADCVG